MKKTTALLATAAALTLGGCAAGPAEDSTSAPGLPAEDFTAGLGQSIAGCKIGLPKEYLSSGNAPEVSAALERAVATRCYSLRPHQYG